MRAKSVSETLNELVYGGTFPGMRTTKPSYNYFTQPTLPKSYKEALDELIKELEKRYGAKIEINSNNGVVIDGTEWFRINWQHLTIGDVRHKITNILEA